MPVATTPAVRVLTLVLLFLTGSPLLVQAQGVGVIDASAGTYLHLDVNDVRVEVENQVAVVTTRQTFRNTTADSVSVKYAFPLPSEASATALRWQNGGTWFDAQFAAAAQDTTLPGSGGGLDPSLTAHLGEQPLFFDFEQTLAPDSALTVELFYVQLLPYAFGVVDFTYPNQYGRIQTEAIDRQAFTFQLTSPRRIEALNLVSHLPTATSNDGAVALVASELIEAPAGVDYQVQYVLSQDELGLFGFSTALPDSAVADGGPNGFFAFVAEPDPSEGTDVLQKVFTLVIDRSGSMDGTKIRQARQAAEFVVNNLNEGDRFNIVDFSTDVRSFRPDHVAFDGTTRADALTYISRLRAEGATNISGALGEAIAQFDVADTGTANLVIFFTDGEATAGLTGTDEIVDFVGQRVAASETALSLFTFGIGSNVQRPLLTQLAAEHNGLVAFLDNNEVEARISEFYLTIRNPVLLGTELTFDPPVAVDVLPGALPNLYRGQQLVVAGRYAEAQPVQIRLSGEAFGQPVDYTYTLALADAPADRFQFLPKVWAKLQIEALLVRYYALDEDTAEAQALRRQITDLSLAFGVISPFTSFQGGEESPDDGGSQATATEDIALPTSPLSQVEAYPNPFRGQTTIRFSVEDPAIRYVTVRIYNVLGQLVRVLAVPVHGLGVHEVTWDGQTDAGGPAPSGLYVYVVDAGDALLSGRVTRIR
ncbi:MAG: VWA domain-containing protein [Bacteroidota bacterium]